MQFATGFCTYCCMTNWAWSFMRKASDVQKRFCAQTDILVMTPFIFDINDPNSKQIALGMRLVVANSSTFKRTTLWKKWKVTQQASHNQMRIITKFFIFVYLSISSSFYSGYFEYFCNCLFFPDPPLDAFITLTILG